MTGRTASRAEAHGRGEATVKTGRHAGPSERSGGMASLVGPLGRDFLHFITSRRDPVAEALNVEDIRKVAELRRGRPII